MTRPRWLRIVLATLVLLALPGGARLVARAQHPPGAPAASGGPAAPGHHGTPEGWTFAWPAGDAAKGRAMFVKLECYSCHEVRGETFPAPKEAANVGPELAQMGPLHEPEYFAEAVINPSAVIERGKGYEAQDGSSKMPSYNDAVTVQEVVDLVAYLRALKPPAGTPAGHGGPGGHKTR